jgi:hypothetical protein
VADRKPPAKGGLFGRLLGGEGGKPRKGMPLPKKRVWRISESAPAGEWVDADSISSQSPPVTKPAELPSGDWLTSSMDLLGGAEVREELDTELGGLDDQTPTLPLPRRPK